MVTGLDGGAFLVRLEETEDAGEIGPAVADAMRIVVPAGREPFEMVANWLGSRAALLIFDNMEQIVDAAAVILSVLNHIGGIRILATSRRALRIRGERVFEVTPLATGFRHGTTVGAELPAGVELFMERATAVGAAPGEGDFANIAAICRRLDGLPLAIELAAARSRIFDPAELLTRLDRRLPLLTTGSADLPARQRSFRDTIAWSVDLLQPQDQIAFAKLAVFRGGWSLEAAEAICGADVDVHTDLVEAALLTRDDARFRMLETIREFAAERFAASADLDEVMARHAVWFTEWVQHLVPEGMQTARQTLESRDEFATLAPERENLHASMDRLLSVGDLARARQLAVALWLYWLGSGDARRADKWMQQLVAAEADDSAESVWLYAIAGEFPRFAGDHDRAIAIKERALVLARTFGDGHMEAAVLADLTGLWIAKGDLGVARDHAERSLELRRRGGSPDGIAHGLSAVAAVETHTGNLERARDLMTEANALSVQEMDRAFTALDLADIQRRLGDTDQAAMGFQQTIRMVQGWGHLGLIGNILARAAALLSDLGRYDQAAVVLGAYEAVLLESGLADEDAPQYAETRSQVEATMSDDVLGAAWSRGRQMSGQEALAYVGGLLGKDNDSLSPP
jgi:predicted ATPase